MAGRGGADVMAGGTGNDVYYVDSADDRIIEAAGQGIDKICSTVDYTLAAGVEVKYLRAYGTGLTLTGNEFDNNISGSSGSDTLNGGEGNDHLAGHGGADITAGGLGNDVHYVDNAGDQVTEVAGQGIDKICSTVDYTLAAGQEVEYLRTYSAAGLTLTGNELANDIAGNSGSDTLNGGGGDDRLSGRGGADVMAGGTGNDVYYVNDPGDQVIEGTGQGTDTIRSIVDYVLAAGQEIENLRVFGTAGLALTGNGFDNHLSGSSGSDTLNGGEGDDTLTGGAGSDIFAFDTAIGAGDNIDLVADFAPGTDIIQLDQSFVFAGLTAGQLSLAQFSATGTATGSGPQIVYDRSTGALFYDGNGAAAGGASQFATVSGHPTLTNTDFKVV